MGNITEIAGGKISELSTQEIENNAGSFISNIASKFLKQKGEQEGVTYSNPPNDERKVNNLVEGVAIFRRKKDYGNKPNFGFDWYIGNSNGTVYTEPFSYDSIVLDGQSSLKKEYVPYFKYIPMGQYFFTNAGVNSGKSELKINGEEYLVPWFSGFAKDSTNNNLSYELDLFFNINKATDGEIRVRCKNSSVEIVFSDTNKNSFELTEADNGTLEKHVKITFLDYIQEDTCITVTFHKKPEQKPEQNDEKKEKEVNTLDTVYVVPGQLMGVLNIYKNNIEYNLDIKYVKVYFSGWLKIEGQEEKIFLRGRNMQDYIESPDIIKKTKKIEEQKKALEQELSAVNEGKGGWFSDEKTLQERISRRESELKELSDLSKERMKLGEEIYNHQTNVLEIGFKNLLSKYGVKIKDTFSQALIHYLVKGEESIEINLDDLDDDIYIRRKKTGWELMEKGLFSNDGDASYIQNFVEKLYREKDQSFQNTIVLLLPFDIDGLFGQSESIFTSADNVIVGPAIIDKKDWITIPHEVAHSLGLSHSFPDISSNKIAGFFEGIVKEGHLFRQGETENVMDYIYGDLIVTFWKWQWNKLHKDNKDMKQIVNLVTNKEDE